MAGYKIRPLAELSQQARGFFTQSVTGAIASVWANTFTVFAKVLGLLNFEHEQRRAFLYDQIFASRAGKVWLLRHGFELGLQPFPALSALGTATADATPGLTIPAGLRYARADGAVYAVAAEEAAVGNSLTLTLEADAPGGLGNCAAGTVLTLLDPDDAPAGLGRVAVVDGGGLGGGADEEKLEPFRARVLRRKRNPPQGGARPDWETWVGEALGSVVQAVFVDSFSNETRAVWVAFTVGDQPNGIPTDAQVALVQAYINDPVRRPVTARAYAIKLALLPIPVAIQGLAPDTADVRASVEAELAAEFLDRAGPGLPSQPATLSRSWLGEAVSRAVGESRHVIALPVADVVVAAGYLPVLGPVTYSDPV